MCSQCVSTNMPTVLTDLWVENRTCSLPCGASQQSSDQICGNWQWFHLKKIGEILSAWKYISCVCSPKGANEPLPSSMSGGSPPTNTLRENRSTRSPLRWGKQCAEPRPASPWSPDSSSPKERSSSMGNKDEWPAENDYVSRLTKQFLTVLISQLAKKMWLDVGKLSTLKKSKQKQPSLPFLIPKVKEMSNKIF